MSETTVPSDSPPRQLPAGFEGPHGCTGYELAGALDLANLVLRTLGVAPGAAPRWPSIGLDYPHIYNAENLENVRVVTHGGRVVCSVGIYPTSVRTPRGTISVGGINAFVTHPDYRRRGLGAAVLQDAHAQMQRNGHHIALLSTRIQDYYRQFGWESAGRQRTFVFDRGNITFLPDPTGLEVTEGWQAYVADLVALHNGEEQVALRGESSFALLAERKAQRVFVAQREGRVTAYAALSGTAVREYGGAPEDVAALLHAVFRQLDDPHTRTSERPPGQRATIEMTVVTPDAAAGLPVFLTERGIPHTLGYLGMIVILDAPGLLRALEIEDVRLEPRARGWQVRHRGQTLEVGHRELVKLIFGPERLTACASDSLPIEFFQWPFDRV